MLALAVAVAVVVVAGVVLVGRWPGGSGGSPEAAGPTTTALPSDSGAPGTPVVPPPPADAVAMAVRYVYDGDTVRLQREAPNDLVTTDGEVDVRLVGVDTPEARPQPECFAAESTAFLRALLPEGARVLVAPDRDTWDDYRRRLFYVWTADGRFVNAELVAGGYAEAIRVWPNVAQLDLLRATEAAAQAAGLGRWGACP